MNDLQTLLKVDSYLSYEVRQKVQWMDEIDANVVGDMPEKLVGRMEELSNMLALQDEGIQTEYPTSEDKQKAKFELMYLKYMISRRMK